MTSPKYIRTCSICRALDVIGDKPTLLILESYWLGTRRFSHFQKQTGLLKTVVSDRLKKLVDAGCFKKTPYSERPKRFEYRGTRKFYDLYPVALSMLQWEQNWGTVDGKIQVNLVHKTCGQATQPQCVCLDCRLEINPRDIAWKEGPGVGMMPAVYNRRRRSSNSTQEPTTQLFEEIVDVIGDRWSALIIRSIFTNLNSYQDICDDTGIATNILAERLERLSETGIIKKQGSVYKLTPKGRAIYPILLALLDWGDKWYATEDGPPLYLTHKPCNTALKSQMACSECGESITMNDIDFEFVESENGPVERMA
ncbi:MAG: winged helix-turn-helix transcriptional regulator [Alphaproteobacteria bacterium]